MEQYEDLCFRNMSSKEQDAVQEVQWELLEEFGRICKRHSINYYAGPELCQRLLNLEGTFPTTQKCKIFMNQDDYNKFSDVVGDELDFKTYFWCYQTVLCKAPFIKGFFCKNGTSVFRQNAKGGHCKSRIALEIVCLYPWKTNKHPYYMDMNVFYFFKIKNRIQDYETQSVFSYKFMRSILNHNRNEFLRQVKRNCHSYTHYMDLSEAERTGQKFIYQQDWFKSSFSFSYKNMQILIPSGYKEIIEMVSTVLAQPFRISKAVKVKEHYDEEKQATGNLRRLQLVELELLLEVDRICRKHGIRYSLLGGTLIGALRHQGFIPWDDDIDIAFERKDYERILQILPQEIDEEKYFLQTIDTDAYYCNIWARLQRKGTTFAEPSQLLVDVQKGIHIDLLPYDHIHQNKVAASCIQFLIARLKTIMWSNKGKIVSKRASSKFFYSALALIPKKWAYRRIINLCMLSEKNKGHAGYFINVPQFEYTQGFCALDFQNVIDMTFEGYQLMVIKNWPLYIQYFQDFMSYPPKEERVAHCPAVVDVGALYQEVENCNESNQLAGKGYSC